MSDLLDLLVFALMAVFVENLVFTGGIGASRMLRAARKPKELLRYGFLVMLFSLASGLLAPFIGGLLLKGANVRMMRPLVFCVCGAAVYVVICVVLRFGFAKVYNKVSKLLPIAAFNGVVLALPYIVNKEAMNLLQTIGFSVGTGVGYMLAVFLTSEGIRRLDNPQMPKAFRGLPALFLYIGILSMAFVGLSGKSIF